MSERMRSVAYAMAYANCLPQLRVLAREHGYALACHGSMQTDLDLIAVPWTDEASDAPTLIEAIRLTVNGHLPNPPGPEWKPHGRLAWSIYFDPRGGSPYLDISVMPRARDWWSDDDRLRYSGMRDDEIRGGGE